ncbi:MAG: DUF1440 domain-containing protein [Rhizobacter sp.]
MPRTNTNDTRPGDLMRGAASGLAAGLVGAVAMTAFQALLARGRITSGVSGAPSTEKAADALALATVGHGFPRSRRPAAGETVHNAFGALVGGAYGIAAEVDPRVTRGGGAAFGAVAATVVDETLVPAFRLGDPFWRAPIFSHPYSYLSHVVFGTVTEAARKVFRRFFRQVEAGAAVVRRQPEPPVVVERPAPDARHTLSLACLGGACAGPRTSAPLAIASWAARLGWIDVKGSPLAFLASPRAVSMTTPMALGELVVDKLPSTPSRTQAVGVAARVASGAVSGAALAGGRSARAALAGAAGALVATYVGHSLRTQTARAFGRDVPVAAVEDLLAFGGAAMVCLAALAPAEAEARSG